MTNEKLQQIVDALELIERRLDILETAVGCQSGKNLKIDFDTLRTDDE